MYIILIGSIVYNRAWVRTHQIFRKNVVHVIIIDQWNKTARLYKIHETFIYSRAIIVRVPRKKG